MSDDPRIMLSTLQAMMQLMVRAPDPIVIRWDNTRIHGIESDPTIPWKNYSPIFEDHITRNDHGPIHTTTGRWRNRWNKIIVSDPGDEVEHITDILWP